MIFNDVGNGCRTKYNRSLVDDVDDVVSSHHHPSEDMMEQQIHDQEVFGMTV